MAAKRASHRLSRMRANPADDWSIEDVASLCREHQVQCSPPRGGGSHWKLSDPSQRDILAVPHRRPVRPHYIREVVKFIDAVMEARNGNT
jgi:hypothetical protein